MLARLEKVNLTQSSMTKHSVFPLPGPKHIAIPVLVEDASLLGAETSPLQQYQEASSEARGITGLPRRPIVRHDVTDWLTTSSKPETTTQK
jgi:hypothetical protein